MDSQPHILVVDDDREIRDLLSKFLERQGMRVTAARDARDRYDVAVAAGRPADPGGVNRLRARLAARLSEVDSAALAGEDARALGIMRRTLAEPPR